MKAPQPSRVRFDPVTEMLVDICADAIVLSGETRAIPRQLAAVMFLDLCRKVVDETPYDIAIPGALVPRIADEIIRRANVIRNPGRAQKGGQA